MGRDREKGGWWVWEEIERKVAGGCGKRHRERWRVGVGRDREKGGWWVWEEIERKVAGWCGKRHRERWRVGGWERLRE